MALRSWTPDKGFITEKVVRPASVSTSLSLELCTFPTTLGSSVATAALEQLLVVEKSLQGDYFTCNEEVITFLKDIIVAVKKLEEMRKEAIELLEIESMELSRLYFLLETVPNSINRELEECVSDARKLNILEVNQMRTKVERMDNEVKFLKKRINDLMEKNEALGEKQEELAKEHEQFVLLLNQTMEEKAKATIYINDTYTKINFEKEEIVLQKQCLREANDLMERHKTEYHEKKDQLITQMKEFKQSCEASRKETYSKKKELTRLQNKIIKMKETVTSSTAALSDNNLELSQLQESLSIWEKKVEDMKKACKNMEEKLLFFRTHQERLDSSCSLKKAGLLSQIQQVGEKLQKAQLENKDLQDRYHLFMEQQKLVEKEENEAFLQKQKAHDEYQKQVELISHKESVIALRKRDITSMEEGYGTLQNLLEATKEVYRKQIKAMITNVEREIQRSVITQWRVTCSRRRHARWLNKIRAAMRKIISQIERAEKSRIELLKETKEREEEIAVFVKEIERLKVELVVEEDNFVIKEKKLMQELCKCEDLVMKEAQANKEKEEELVVTLPQLEIAEEDYKEKNKSLKSLHNELAAKKQEENLLNSYIFRFRKDIIRYKDNTESLKQEVKQLRELESTRIKEHFEILKNIEHDIYVNDQKTILLILENKKLKEHIAYLKKQIEIYREKQQITVQNSGDLSWQLIVQHKHYTDSLAQFQIRIKEMMDVGKDILQEITALIEKLQYRDGRIEAIRTWLQRSIENLQILMTEESQPEIVHEQHLGKFEKKRKKKTKMVRLPPAIRARRNALTGSSK